MCCIDQYQLSLQDFNIYYCLNLSLCEEKQFINFIKKRKTQCCGKGIIVELLLSKQKINCHQVY